MRPIRSFIVVPSLPRPLKRLEDLAQNLWWTWDHEAIALFRRIDQDLWETSGHNPVKMLGMVGQERLRKLAKDEGFLAQLERVDGRLNDYLGRDSWFQKTYPDQNGNLYAYFSAEFGLSECMPIYSGGLGILAGDHLKAAAELGLPFLGVGLLYQVGYFGQYLNADGWQQELYPENDFANMPIRLLHDDKGRPRSIKVNFPGRSVQAQIWQARVGRLRLLLLDTNTELNPPADRKITGQLYGGDSEIRIQQEIILGIGGVRALQALDLPVKVFHMNEGHSAFLALERIRQYMHDYKLPFSVAREATVAGNVFTTHTPEPAGIDIFDPALMQKYFLGYHEGLGISWDDFMGLGRIDSTDEAESFSMAVLALKLAAHANGVSKLHGQVSRQMWGDLWPDISENERPIISITNGIHPRSWISNDMLSLYDRYLGPDWVTRPADHGVWERVSDIPDEELWRTHERRRARLVAYVRRRLQAQLLRQGAVKAELRRATGVLDPDVLTIGFARRFAPYKRANLILNDPERLLKLLNCKDRPLQIIFAGKSHPRNDPGKELIRSIVHFARREDVRDRVVFVEDYDMHVARYLVQGVDLWLNTPRRPMEASGTSGMKAAFNGSLNMSTMDGWWDEAYRPGTGWAIGQGEEYQDLEYQEEVEANIIYELLEKEVVPLFYDRGNDNIPYRWIEYMKASLRAFCPVFSTNRMVEEYTRMFYVPACRRSQQLAVNHLAGAKALAQWKGQVEEHWDSIRFLDIKTNLGNTVKVNAGIEFKVHLDLGGLSPDDVDVQLYYGPINAEGELIHGKSASLVGSKADEQNTYLFDGEIEFPESGRHGYTIRILPRHPDLVNPYEMGLVTWADAAE